MIVPIPRTDLVTWIQSWDVFAIVCLLLIVQLFVEMLYGRHATHKQLMAAELSGYDIAGAQTREREQHAREREAEEEKRLRTQLAIAIGRARPVFLTDLPKFARESARRKGIAWSLMPMYRVDREELEV